MFLLAVALAIESIRDERRDNIDNLPKPRDIMRLFGLGH